MNNRGRGLVNQTITEVMQYINEQGLKEGEKLPKEADLAASLKVGRSTLREAVKILSFSNALDVRQGSGTFIKTTSFQQAASTEQLLAAREMIESQAARMIIESHEDMQEMLQLKELLFQRNKLLEDGKFAQYVKVDLSFHEKIITMTKNPYLIKWYNELLPDLQLYLSAQVLKTSDYKDNTELHNELYASLLEKDPQKAETLIRKNSQLS